MTIYRGVGGVNREIKEQYRGVGGVNREIKEQYRGVGGVNRKVFNVVNFNPFTVDTFNNYCVFSGYGTHSLITGYNNTAGCGFIGRNSGSTYAGIPKFEISLDVTITTYIKFHARQIALHGGAYVYMDVPNGITTAQADTYRLLEVSYNNLPTSWAEYTINIASITGTHKFGFAGGYVDSTGNSTSQSQFSNIRFL